MQKYKPIVLVVLDGWGESKNKVGNAILNANLPTIKKINEYYPKALLQASGLSVGLPWGVEGNSEVGHQSLGSGRIIYQNFPRITLAIEDNSFFSNEGLLEAIDWTKKNNSALHLFGLLSDGSVHSHIDHLFALMDLAKDKKIEKLFIHVITDGRDVDSKSANNFIGQLENKIKAIKLGKIASIAGRYYTMDRNENYDRIQKSFESMVGGKGLLKQDSQKAIEEQYKKGTDDEHLEPIVITDKDNNPVGKIEDNDAIIFFNFRKDRTRQITKAFIVPDFNKFNSETKRPKNIKFVTMTQYEKELPVSIAFSPQKIGSCLGKILSENKKTQLRIAETEKYAHVTYFFNVGKEKPFPGENRTLIPSKNLESYADAPEMSADEITKKLIKAIESKKYDFILVNYANPDMVGHTGNLKAGVKAVEYVDACLAELIPSVLKGNGALLITADHGNVEEMLNVKTGEKDTEHSINPVPCWFVTPDNHSEEPDEKQRVVIKEMLCDIAPTVLELLDIKKPKEITGKSLLSCFNKK
jgi:2,3-bisphosphoglycerate-independent phosphoglycerate mutase